MDPGYLIKFLGALFAIMNPFMTLPLFLTLTDGMAPAAQRRVGLAALGYATVMCAVVAVAGNQLLGFFGISVDDFRVAGGLVLMVIAFGMLDGTGASAHTGTPAEQADHAEVANVAFYPLTFPMIVGPGTITTLVVFAADVHSLGRLGAFALVLAAVLAALGVVLFFAAFIGHLMSRTLRVIMGRLMGLILAAIAVEMIATGLKALFPALG